MMMFKFTWCKRLAISRAFVKNLLEYMCAKITKIEHGLTKLLQK